MQITPNIEASHSAYLAGKSFCLVTAQPRLSWVVDSGTAGHIRPDHHLFQSYTLVSRSCFITTLNGRQVQVKHVGTVSLNTEITLQDVLHVLDFQFNLLSASKLAKHLSSSVFFTPSLCYIQDHLKNKQVVLGEE